MLDGFHDVTTTWSWIGPDPAQAVWRALVFTPSVVGPVMVILSLGLSKTTENGGQRWWLWPLRATILLIATCFAMVGFGAFTATATLQETDQHIEAAGTIRTVTELERSQSGIRLEEHPSTLLMLGTIDDQLAVAGAEGTRVELYCTHEPISREPEALSCSFSKVGTSATWHVPDDARRSFDRVARYAE